MRKKTEENGGAKWQSGAEISLCLNARERKRPEAVHWYIGDCEGRFLVKQGQEH